MPSQNDFTPLIDGGLNRRDVNVWVARSDHHGLRRGARRHSDGCDRREQ
jgi:hypothetical protein